MEFYAWFFLGFLILAVLAKVQQDRRIKQAYKWDAKPVQGFRKFPNRKQLRKAGLL